MWRRSTPFLHRVYESIIDRQRGPRARRRRGRVDFALSARAKKLSLINIVTRHRDSFAGKLRAIGRQVDFRGIDDAMFGRARLVNYSSVSIVELLGAPINVELPLDAYSFRPAKLHGQTCSVCQCE